MPMETFFWLFLVFCIGLLLRIHFRLKNKIFGNDVWYHLHIIKHLKKYGKLPEKIDNFTIKTSFAQPSIFYYLFSWIPKKDLLKVGQFFCPVLDSLTIFLVYFVGQTVINPAGGLIAATIYAFSPTNIFESLPFTSRTLGVTFFGLTIYSMYFAPTNEILFGLSILFVALTLNTSKFATQALFLFTVIFSFLQLTGIYLIILSLGTALAILVSKGYYLKVLNNHIEMLKFWKNNISERWKQKGIERNLINLSKTALNPWVIIPFIAFAFYGQLNFWIIGSLTAIVLCILTSFDKLAFLGDNFRYLTFGSFFISIASAEFFAGYETLSPAFFVFCVFSISIHVYLQRWLKRRSHDSIFGKEALSAFDFIKKLKGNMLCIPTSISYVTMYFTNKKVVYCDNDWKLCPDLFPKLKGNLKSIIKKRKVKYILKEKSQKIKVPGKVLFKNKRFEIYG